MDRQSVYIREPPGSHHAKFYSFLFNLISGDGKLSKAELRAAISKVAGLSTIEGTVYILGQ